MMQGREPVESFAHIKVVGAGGGGSNAIGRILASRVRGIDLIAINTDSQALIRSEAPTKIRIGDKVTRGLGAGGNQEVGERSAEESRDEIIENLRGADMVFITAEMGGGTGTGSAPVIAQYAQEIGALTVGVVTRPFSFEGAQRRKRADEGITRLREKVDALIVIPNDRLLALADKRLSITDAFAMADDVLRQGIQGISDLITIPGLINLDFADVKTVMSKSGSALMAIGHGQGDSRAKDAARSAIASPLLDVSIAGAKGLLFNVTGGPDLSLYEINEAAEIINSASDMEAQIIFGAVIDPSMQGTIRITLIATGFDSRPGLGARSAPQPVQPSSELGDVPSMPREPQPRIVSPQDRGIPDFLRRRG